MSQQRKKEFLRGLLLEFGTLRVLSGLTLVNQLVIRTIIGRGSNEKSLIMERSLGTLKIEKSLTKTGAGYINSQVGKRE